MLPLGQQLKLQLTILSIAELLWVHPMHQWLRDKTENTTFLQSLYIQYMAPCLPLSFFFGVLPLPIAVSVVIPTSLFVPTSLLCFFKQVSLWIFYQNFSCCMWSEVQCAFRLKAAKTRYSPSAFLLLQISASFQNLPAFIHTTVTSDFSFPRVQSCYSPLQYFPCDIFKRFNILHCTLSTYTYGHWILGTSII